MARPPAALGDGARDLRERGRGGKRVSGGRKLNGPVTEPNMRLCLSPAEGRNAEMASAASL